MCGRRALQGRLPLTPQAREPRLRGEAGPKCHDNGQTSSKTRPVLLSVQGSALPRGGRRGTGDPEGGEATKGIRSPVPSQALPSLHKHFPVSPMVTPPTSPPAPGKWRLASEGLRSKGPEGEPVLECAGGRQGRCDNYRQQFKQTN